MPEMTAGRRASGGHVPAHDDRPPLPLPDQSRYGSATTDPLGRDGEGWHISPQTLLPTLDKGWRRGPDGRAVRVETKGDRTK